MTLWHDLIHTYAQHPVEAPALKAITLAQWALESNFGTSRLATDHGNFGGLKFRARVNAGRESNPLATPVDYAAHDGEDTYCAFASLADFIDGYWAFIGNTTIYDGWRDFAEDPGGYIGHLKSCGYAQDAAYVSKVLAIVPRIRREIETLGLEMAFSAVEFNAARRHKAAILIGHNSGSKGAFSPFLDSMEWDFNRRVFRHMNTKSPEYQLELREFFRPPNMRYSDEIAAAYSEIDAWEPEAILELHFNSATPSGDGTEMLYWGGSERGKILADAVLAAVLDDLDLPDRGSKGRNSGRGSTSLSASDYPTILTEPFFGSSRADCDKVLAAGEETLARAYLIGIRDALTQMA